MKSLETDAAGLAWLTLSRLPNLGGKRCLRLSQHFGSAAAALDAPVAAWEEVIGPLVAQTARAQEPAWDWAAAQWKRLQQYGGSLIAIGGPDYPPLLLETPDPPALLHVLGDLQRTTAALAIVGTRGPTSYGLKVARQLARALAVRGFGVVSGMARGIDTAAHQGALEAGGRTLAVLGCGADVIYPSENADLHARIRGQGAVISEFPMGSRPESGWFPRRNRLISGLSLGVILVEAPARSGALITARYAREQNREVFAVPGDVRTHKSAGCHQLIRDGARLVERVEDVVEELQHWGVGTLHHEEVVVEPVEPVAAFSAHQRMILRLLDTEPCHIDRLARDVELQAAEILGALLELELAGLVQQLPGKRFARI
jgi:DNA processing protein